jgi:tetratricopeptide (TPR) repeat protein
MVMSPRYSPAACVPLLAAALLGACTVALGAPTPPQDPQDSNALIMTAEIALRRDDCGQASSDYTAAAQRMSNAELAKRAAEVSLGCGQYETAARAAARWHQLLPADPEPLHASVQAALGQYKIDAARSAFQTWLQSSKSAAATPGRAPRGATKGATPNKGLAALADNNVVHQVEQLASESGVPATLAMLRGVQAQPLQNGEGQLALADLAFNGWNYREALQYAQRALDGGAERASAQVLLARAHAGLGEADAAVAAAAAARAAAPKEQTFADADVLILLGREDEARDALEVLGQNPALKTQVQRRLGLLAFSSGQYDVASRSFTALLTDRESSAVAVYYLAAIAERRDELGTALRGYQLLAGTALETTARVHAATMLYKHGHRPEAMKLLAPANDAAPAARVEAEIAQSQLLADGGEGDQAVARIDDALARSPGHPDLLYQKAIVLDKAGHTDAAVAQLEELYRQRPDDCAIANALGFILADHGRDLARAQRLISTALKAEPDNPAILDSLGWLNFKRGNAKLAEPLLERAFRLDQDADIGAHWGEVLWSLGEKAKAREAWSRALVADPDNAAVKAAEDRLGQPQLLSPGTGTSI